MTYTYDRVGQLKSYHTDLASGTESSYSYDRAGNRTYVNVENGSDHNQMYKVEQAVAGNSSYDAYLCQQSGSALLQPVHDGHLAYDLPLRRRWKPCR